MKAGKGHAKGSAFERKIAKEVVKAFKSFGITQRDCWRSTLSGGHSRSAGDLEMSRTLEALFPFCLEMKHRKTIRWPNFLMERNDNEEKRWLAQAVEGSYKREGMTPVLVMRMNNYPIMALVSESNIHWHRTPRLNVDGRQWQLMLWKEFLQCAVVSARSRKKSAA